MDERRSLLSCHAVGLVLVGQEVVNSGFDQVTKLCSALFSLLLDMHDAQNMRMSVFACVWVYISHRLKYMLRIWNWMKACMLYCMCVCVVVCVFVQQCHSQIMSVKWSQCLYNGLFNIRILKESIVLFIELSMKPVQQRERGRLTERTLNSYVTSHYNMRQWKLTKEKWDKSILWQEPHDSH